MNTDSPELEQGSTPQEQAAAPTTEPTQPPPLSESLGGDSIFIANSTGTGPNSSSSLSALSGSISGDGFIDPITEAIRKEILEKQRDELRKYLSTINKELDEHTKDDEKFRLFLANLNDQQRGFVDNALKNEKVKAELEKIELAGYRYIHTTYSADNYPNGFRKMQWSESKDQQREQIVNNGVGDPICTLTETTHNTAPFVVDQGGKKVTINSYRTIDFPVELSDNASGTMHLSLTAQDKDGKPLTNKAVYFTAHYEATPAPDGKPLLKEISSPQPIKFLGTGDAAVGYIEHGGEIYTLPVTQGKYKAMMLEVAKNKGQGVNLSQSIAEDLVNNQQQEQTITPQQINPANEKPIEVKNTEISEPQSGVISQRVPPITQNPNNQSQQARNSQVTQPQPQQAESSGIPNQAVKAAIDLSQAMQDLISPLVDNNTNLNSIKNAAEKILQDKTTNFDEKQAGIKALSENILNNKDLSPDIKVQGVNAILDTIAKDTNLQETEKAKLFEGIANTVLNADSLGLDSKKQILEKVAESALGLNDEAGREEVINNIVDNIIGSNLKNEEKWQLLNEIDNKVNDSKLSEEERSKLHDSILDKSVKAGVLDPLQQNIDVVDGGKQSKNAEIEQVKNILSDPTKNIDNKKQAIIDTTKGILDNQILNPDQKGQLIEGVTKEVANSSLDVKDKTDIVKNMGTAVVDHKIEPETQKIVIASIEKGIANSETLLEQQKQMTMGLVNGIYDSSIEPSVKSEMTKSVLNGIDGSTAIDENKKILKETAKETANEAIVDIETKNLSTDLSKDSQIDKHDVFKAAGSVTNALRGVLDPVENVLSQSQKEQNTGSQILDDKIVAEQTIKTLDDPNYIFKADSIRSTLSSSKTFDTQNPEEKIDGLVQEFNSKSSTQEKLDFIQTNLIDDKTLSKDIRSKVIENLLQKQHEERGEAVKNPNAKTQDVRVLTGKSELKPVSKDDPDIEKAKMVVGKGQVNTKDNVRIMGVLMNAQNTISSENTQIVNKSSKSGPSFP